MKGIQVNNFISWNLEAIFIYTWHKAPLGDGLTIQTWIDTKHRRVPEITVCSNEGVIIVKLFKYFKILRLQSHLGNANQTWHNGFIFILMKDSALFQYDVCIFCKDKCWANWLLMIALKSILYDFTASITNFNLLNAYRIISLIY